MSLDRYTELDVEFLVLDDAGPERVTADLVGELLAPGRRWRLHRNRTNLGFVATANVATGLRAGRDVVLVNSDVEVFAGWLNGLRMAALSGPHVASASAISNNGSILTVPVLSTDVHALANDVRQLPTRSLATTAPIPVAVGHCLYLRDDALSAVGSFDLRFSPGYGEEVDWSIRARRRGWTHVAALRTVVWHDAGSSFGMRLGTAKEFTRRKREVVLASRYPREWLEIRRFAGDSRSELARSLATIAGLAGNRPRA
jgi:GT2 family glycosyltransferase